MSVSDGNELYELTEKGLAFRRELLRQMKPSHIHGWDWSVPEFAEALEWLKGHPHVVRRSVFLSDSPGKEVWQLTVPEHYGGKKVVFKSYLRPTGMMKIFELSPACVEACNYAVLSGIGIASAKVLACGESRSWGSVTTSFIVTEYLPDTIDGSALMPGGFLWDDQEMRMTFARNALDLLAVAHRCRFFHRAFHPHKILIAKDGTEDKQQLTLIDVASGGLKRHGNVKRDIVKDLYTLFTDLRLSSDEIKRLCQHYLQENPEANAKFDVQSLWKALCRFEP